MFTIGIGIPVRNGEKYLEQAIASAIAQIDPADEILIVLNNSTDRSLEIAKSFGSQVRIVIDDSITSIGTAWNALYQHSQCDYLVMLHQDDLLYPESIQILREILATHKNLGLIFGRTNILSATGQIQWTNYTPAEVCFTGADYLAQVLEGLLPCCSGTCINKNVLLNSPFRTDFKILLDLEFFIRIGWLTPVMGIPAILACYRLHPESTFHADSSWQHQTEDLQIWWQATLDHTIPVPEQIADRYKAKVFKRIVTAFLTDLWSDRYSEAQEWLKFLEVNLKKYPMLYRQAFTYRSLMVYCLARSGNWGYQLAMAIAKLHARVFSVWNITRLKMLKLFSQRLEIRNELSHSKF